MSYVPPQPEAGQRAVRWIERFHSYHDLDGNTQYAVATPMPGGDHSCCLVVEGHQSLKYNNMPLLLEYTGEKNIHGINIWRIINE